MRRALAVLLLAAPGALAELGIFVVESGGERPVGAVYEFGTVDTGDVRDVAFRIRNLGNAPVVVPVPTVGGVGFRPSVAPAQPQTLAAGAALDITVRFQPAAPASYSATLTAGTASTIVHGTGVAAPLVLLDESGMRRPLTPGATDRIRSRRARAAGGAEYRTGERFFRGSDRRAEYRRTRLRWSSRPEHCGGRVPIVHRRDLVRTAGGRCFRWRVAGWTTPVSAARHGRSSRPCPRLKSRSNRTSPRAAARESSRFDSRSPPKQRGLDGSIWNSALP